MTWSLGFAVFVLALVVAMVLSLVLGLRPLLGRRPRAPQFRPDALTAAWMRILGLRKPSRVERLPNGWAYYFDLPGGARFMLVRRVAVFLERIGGRVVPFVVRRVAGAAVGDNGLPARSQLIVFQVSLTPASVATIVVAEQLITVTGVRSDDVVISSGPQAAPGNSVGPTYARASAANQIGQSYANPTAGALVPTAGTYNVTVLRG